MTIAHQTLDPVPLTEFVRRLGVGDEVLHDKDKSRSRFALESRTPVAEIGIPSPEEEAAVVRAYGEMASVSVVRAPDSQSPIVLYELGINSVRDLAEELQQMAQRVPDEVLAVRVSLDKSGIASQLSSSGLVRGYLFLSTLVELLEGPVSEAASQLWGGRQHEHCHVIVGDSSVMCRGPFLTISGPEATDRPEEMGSHYSSEYFQQIHAARSEVVRWSESGLSGGLIPRSFLLQICDTPRLGALADRAVLEVSLAHLADRAERDGFRISGQLVATTGFVSIPSSLEPRPIRREQIEALVEAVEWAYEKGGDVLTFVSGRLPPLQARMAELLASVPRSERIYQLAEMSQEVLSSAKWQWRNALSEEAVAALEREVHATEQTEAAAQGFVDETRAITDGLLATVRGAAIAMVGAFVASALDPRVSHAAVVAVGSAYAVLVLLTAITSLLPARRRIDHKWTAYQLARKKRERVLGPELVRSIEDGRPSREKGSANTWLLMAAVFYGFLTVGSVLFALEGEHVVPNASSEAETTNGPQPPSRTP